MREPGYAQNGAYCPLPGRQDRPNQQHLSLSPIAGAKQGRKSQDKRGKAGRQAQHGGVSGQGHPSLPARPLHRAIRLSGENWPKSSLESKSSDQIDLLGIDEVGSARSVSEN
jgi:hypothetical protein